MLTSRCALTTPRRGLAMHQLHFQAEVRSIKELGVEPAAVSDAELKLAEQLIDHLAAKRFDPNEYHDEFKGRIDAEEGAWKGSLDQRGTGNRRRRQCHRFDGCAADESKRARRQIGSAQS